MTDARTTAQREADDALDAAIRATHTAYEDQTGSGLPIEWVVTGTAISSDPDGDEDRTFVLLPDGGLRTPRPHVLGMLRSAQIIVEAEMREGL